MLNSELEQAKAKIRELEQRLGYMSQCRDDRLLEGDVHAALVEEARNCMATYVGRRLVRRDDLLAALGADA